MSNSWRMESKSEKLIGLESTLCLVGWAELDCTGRWIGIGVTSEARDEMMEETFGVSVVVEVAEEESAFPPPFLFFFFSLLFLPLFFFQVPIALSTSECMYIEKEYKIKSTPGSEGADGFSNVHIKCMQS